MNETGKEPASDRPHLLDEVYEKFKHLDKLLSDTEWCNSGDGVAIYGIAGELWQAIKESRSAPEAQSAKVLDELEATKKRIIEDMHLVRFNARREQIEAVSLYDAMHIVRQRIGELKVPPHSKEIIEVDAECWITYSDGTGEPCQHRPTMTFQECAPRYASHGHCPKWNYYHKNKAEFRQTTPAIPEAQSDEKVLDDDKLFRIERLAYEGILNHPESKGYLLEIKEITSELRQTTTATLGMTDARRKYILSFKDEDPLLMAYVEGQKSVEKQVQKVITELEQHKEEYIEKGSQLMNCKKQWVYQDVCLGKATLIKKIISLLKGGEGK